MNRKFRKAIKDSFSFPETERKEEFFAKAETAPGGESGRRYGSPVLISITTAAAACAAAFGLWCGLKYSSVGNKPDFRGDTVITGTVSTAVTSTVTTDEASHSEKMTQLPQTTASTVTTAVSSEAPATTTVHVTDTVISTNQPAATSLMTTLPPTVTTDVVTVPAGLEDYERSIIMKKIASYTTALAMLSTAIPTGAAAEYIPPEPTEAQLAIYSTLDEGSVDLDFNEDGEVDLKDVYRLYSAAHNFDATSSDAKMYFSTHGDANGDGTTNHEDAEVLIKYFAYKYGVPAEAFNVNNYKNDEGNITAGSYMFVYELMNEAENYNILYGYIADKIDAGSYDIDVNADGIVNEEDAFDYYIYHYSKSYMRITQGIELPGENTVIGADIWAKCDALNKALAADDLCSYDDSAEPIAKYVFYKNGVTSDSMSVNRYRELLSTLPNNELVLREGDFRQIAYGVDYTNMTVGYFYTKSADIFSAMVKEIAVESGMATIENRRDKAFMDFDDAYYDEKYAAFEADIEAGVIPPPDFNNDLRCDESDLTILRKYYEDICQMKNASESDIEPEIWNFIDSEFDIDGNGISGDVYDVFMAETYILKNVGFKGNADELLEAYAKKKAAENADIVSKQQISFLADLDVKRSGDANNDGQVNMADAVMIMQTVTNPDKYQLSDWGEFNADIADTGDGVTANDACLLQKNLLNK